MAQSTVQERSRRIQFQEKITEEWFRENEFASFMGTNPTAVIHRILDLQGKGGMQVNLPVLKQLRTQGKGRGTLVGNEENLDNYGCRMYADTSRNAVVMTKSEQQEDNGQIWSRAQPILSNWGINLQRDEIIAGLMALPSESPPANWRTDDGDRVNGVRYEAASAGQKNTWHDDNSDRILYGASISNFVASDHAASLGNVDTTNDLFTGKNLKKLKSLAKSASPKIAPTRYNAAQNRRYFAVFCGSITFADLKEDLKQLNVEGYPRSNQQNGGSNNPVFQDGDIWYDGMIIREFPEIDEFNTTWGLGAAGAASARVNPVFLCGQSAVGMPWAQMPTPTTKKEDDYGHNPGRGIECMYGTGKVFAKDPQAGTALKQWGVVTGFFANSTL